MRSRTVTYQGETITVKELAKIVGLPTHIVRTRIFNHGWTIEESISTPYVERDGTLITFCDKTLKASEWAKQIGVCRETILSRKRCLGWSDREIILTPVLKTWDTRPKCCGNCGKKVSRNAR